MNPVKSIHFDFENRYYIVERGDGEKILNNAIRLERVFDNLYVK